MSNRVALITGGGSGIGRGVALALARRGMDVALAGRRPELLEQTAVDARIQGVRAVVLPADLTEATQSTALVERARAALGPLDVLVNNAGALSGGALDSLAPEAIEQAVALNLIAPMLLTRAALPDLAAQRGAVVLVASMASLLPLPFASVYTATKSGLRGFGAALRYELEPLGVRLLVAYPPSTETAMTSGMLSAAGLPLGFPLARFRSPEAVGEEIVAALVRGRHELVWNGGERLAAQLYAFAPWLVNTVFRSQRERFRRVMRSV